MGGNFTPVHNNTSLFVHPPYLQQKSRAAVSAVWVKNDQVLNMVALVIEVTTGVHIKKDVKAYVSDINNQLIAFEKMMKMVSDVNVMHQLWCNTIDRASASILQAVPRLWDFTTTFLD